MLKESWGFPLNGSSPTSRPAMRLAASLLRPFLRSHMAHGDTLCLLVECTKVETVDQTCMQDKVAFLTDHYF